MKTIKFCTVCDTGSTEVCTVALQAQRSLQPGT